MINLIKEGFFVASVTEDEYLKNKNFYDTLSRTDINYDISLGFIKPKLVNNIYIEGATQEEIDIYNDQFYPNEISRRQLKLQWQLDGRELSEIDNILNMMPDTTESQRISKITAKNAWQESIVFERKDMLIQSLGLTLFNNIQELNNFFLRASQK